SLWNDGPETGHPAPSFGRDRRFLLLRIEGEHGGRQRPPPGVLARGRDLGMLQRLQLVVMHLVAHNSPLRVFFAAWMCQETVASLQPMISPASAWLNSSAVTRRTASR